jgi:translation initiation factor 1
MSKSDRLVYSTDPAQNIRCPKCKELLAACRCAPKAEPKTGNYIAHLRIERTGRQGKTVTVIDGLPKMEIFLKPLCRELKEKCGAGGTFKMDKKDGVIEIQGDNRDKIRVYLAKKNIRTKG